MTKLNLRIMSTTLITITILGNYLVLKDAIRYSIMRISNSGLYRIPRLGSIT